MTTKKKPKPLFLVAFVGGGNLQSISTCEEEELIERIKDLVPQERDSDKPMSDDELKGIMKILRKNPGNAYRFQDVDGDDDISVVNVTGMKFKPNMEIW